MRPLLVVTGPGPLWASQVPARHSIRYKPRPDLFGQFARAAALRYAGAVDRWIIWNEPNLPLWLQPQNTCKGKRCTPYAPHLYRRLVRAAYPAIKAVDPTSTVLFGALAPNGENSTKQNARTRPLAFIRSLGCVKVTLKRDRSGPCNGLQAAHRRRPGLSPPRHHARAQRAAGDPRQRLDRRPPAPGAHARRDAAGGRAQEGRRRQVRPLLHRVGLSDAPARQHARRLAGQAVALPAAGRLHRLQGPAGQAPDPVRVARRAHPPLGQRPLLRVAVGPALRQRQGQALAGDLREPVLHRPASGQPQRPTLGPGAPGGHALRHGGAPPRRQQALDEGQDADDQRRRLLEADPDGHTRPPTTASRGSRPTIRRPGWQGQAQRRPARQGRQEACVPRAAVRPRP